MAKRDSRNVDTSIQNVKRRNKASNVDQKMSFADVWREKFHSNGQSRMIYQLGT